MNEGVFFKPSMLHRQSTFQRRAEPDSIAEGNTIGGFIASDDFGGAEVGKLGFEYFRPEYRLNFKQLRRVSQHQLRVDWITFIQRNLAQ